MLSTTVNKKVEVQIFVTSQEAVEENYGVGKWFCLSNYQNKEAFIAAANKYVSAKIRGVDHVLYFANTRADFDFFKALIRTDDISRQVWAALQMSEQQLKLVDGWHSLYGITGEGVDDMLLSAQASFEGAFEDDTAYAINHLKKFGASDVLVESLVESSHTGVTDLSVIAEQMNASEDVIDMLYEHKTLEEASSNIMNGSFSHKGYYFEA